MRMLVAAVVMSEHALTLSIVRAVEALISVSRREVDTKCRRARISTVALKS
jgi:hypothetical protein